MKLFRKKKNQTEQSDTTKMLEIINTIDKLSVNGLIAIDEYRHRVVISATLAKPLIAHAVRWENFLSNLQVWMLYYKSLHGWHNVFLKAETSAVREAKKKYAMLTEAQIATVRAEAREKVDVTELSLPEVGAMDFVVVSGASLADETAKAVVVGRYENGKMQMKPLPKGGFA